MTCHGLLGDQPGDDGDNHARERDEHADDSDQGQREGCEFDGLTLGVATVCSL
jgi:hypothetical protein